MLNTPLKDVLQIKKGDIITAVGAGGKTTFLEKLAKELIYNANPIIMTTTTKIFPPKNHANLFLAPCGRWDSAMYESINRLSSAEIIYLGKNINQDGKIIGLFPHEIDALKERYPYILVEGDGSARKGFKAPSENEPVVPLKTNILCPIVSVKSIGRPFSDAVVHRKEAVQDITGLKDGEIITAKSVAAVLWDTRGYYRNDYEYIPIINQVETIRDKENAIEIAKIIFDRIPIKKVVLTALKQKNYLKGILKAR